MGNKSHVKNIVLGYSINTSGRSGSWVTNLLKTVTPDYSCFGLPKKRPLFIILLQFGTRGRARVRFWVSHNLPLMVIRPRLSWVFFSRAFFFCITLSSPQRRVRRGAVCILFIMVQYIVWSYIHEIWHVDCLLCESSLVGLLLLL